MKATKRSDLQDGMLAHYLAQAAASDTNVEARLEREPFDFRDMTRRARHDDFIAKLRRVMRGEITPKTGV